MNGLFNREHAKLIGSDKIVIQYVSRHGSDADLILHPYLAFADV